MGATTHALAHDASRPLEWDSYAGELTAAWREAIAATSAVSREPMFDVLESDPRSGAPMRRMRVRVCPPA